MGKRGPAPTPTAILAARGSWRAKENKNEPQPELGTPKKPNWLKGDAKKCWEALVPQLKIMGVLSKIDGNALSRYCKMWGDWRKLDQFLEKNGSTFPLKKDGVIYEIKQFPQSKMAQQIRDQLLRLEKEFGLTPSARARMTTEIQDKPIDKGNFYKIKTY